MSRKRPKQLHDQQQKQHQLIPVLPDHIAHLCLSKIHPKFLYSVCTSWRKFIYSPLFPPFLSLYAIFTPSHSPSSQLITPIQFSAFDPLSARWQALPPPPDSPLQLLLRHPSFISRNLPIQSVAVRDRLVVVAGTTQHLQPAIQRPAVFTPLSKRGEHWGHGPEIPVPRRWCAAGALGGSVYIASGVGSQFSTDVARSVEKWDPTSGPPTSWEKTQPLHDGRFSRESADAVGWKGKLCMVNVKGDAAKQGAVYDSEKDKWAEMSEGMVYGWRGPAAAMDEAVVYAVDVSKGVLRKYDEVRDIWVDVLKNEKFCGAKHMAARGGRVCVVCGGGGEIVVVDVEAAPAKMWAVEPPCGLNAVAVHILPRMCTSESQP